MCRWFAYSGAPVPLARVLIEPENSLIHQSISSKSAETPTNGDGFGVGWYGKRPTPGVFRSIRPAWNDFNLRDLAALVESHLFIAHVRATSMARVEETNCHPFRHKNWLFVHNGEIFGIETIRKALVTAVKDELFPLIEGTTDSEVMFYLALTFGLETDPLGALARMAGFVEATARAKGIDEALWMTLGALDGESLYAVRYASDGKAPTLFHSKAMGEVWKDHPGQGAEFGPTGRFVVSEVGGKYPEHWIEVPQSSCLKVTGPKIEVMPFRPVAP